LTAVDEYYRNVDLKELAKYTMAVAVMMTGAAAHRIRRFEEAGLLKPQRTGNKQRLYSDRDIELIRRIVALEQSGVNLPGIKIILDLQAAKK
jgi:MerR family transcriptional regulator, heat shock protein HspR